MNKNNHRAILFVCAPTSGGKSRLGYVLGEQEEALYSYSSISPSNFFNEKGDLINKYYDNPNLIVSHFNKLNRYLRGQNPVNEKKKWLGNDKLFHYDFDLFDKKIENFVKNNNKQIKLDNFYFNYDMILQESRKNGKMSSYSVYEIEGAENINYLKIIKNKLKNVVVFSILRDPFKIIASNKVIALVRGSTKKEFKGGFLNRNDFNFLIYIKQIQDQYKWLLYQKKKKSNEVIILDFDDLKLMTPETSKLISTEIFKNHNLGKNALKDITERIKISSSKTVFKSEYIFIDHISTKYYSEDWQKHLPVRLTKKNRFDYMYKWELSYYKVYEPFYKYLKNDNYKISLLSTFWILFFLFPYLFLSSFIFGFKEVRINLNLMDHLKLRYNAVRFLTYSYIWSLDQFWQYWK